MSMAELVAAGAPELPEGYFYRVRKTNIRSLKVEIRHQRGRWRSSRVDDAWVFHGQNDTAEEDVVDACVRAIKSWHEQAGDRMRYQAALTLRGDHDPKGGRA